MILPHSPLGLRTEHQNR